MLMLLLWRGVSWPTLPASARMLHFSDAGSIRHVGASRLGCWQHPPRRRIIILEQY